MCSGVYFRGPQALTSIERENLILLLIHFLSYVIMYELIVQIASNLHCICIYMHIPAILLYHVQI